MKDMAEHSPEVDEARAKKFRAHFNSIDEFIEKNGEWHK